ncbi:MAG: amidohydrolase family protein, partial [Candidatus Bathyarchaeota archaeon]|nr:amidohydrolase family protein [Candidatus Bathyarchaeota archaeon]
YPTVVSWLVSRKAREKTMETVNKRGLRKSTLPTIDREYDLYEVAILTRASPAKILGLKKEKGHLGIGADADVAIYNINPEKVDISRDYNELVEALKRAAYTFKDGELVVKDGEIVKHIYGKTYYVNCKIPSDLEKSVISDVEARFREWYSISLNSYVIGDRDIRFLKPLEVSSSLK